MGVNCIIVFNYLLLSVGGSFIPTSLTSDLFCDLPWPINCK